MEIKIRGKAEDVKRAVREIEEHAAIRFTKTKKETYNQGLCDVAMYMTDYATDGLSVDMDADDVMVAANGEILAGDILILPNGDVVRSGNTDDPCDIDVLRVAPKPDPDIMTAINRLERVIRRACAIIISRRG